jgi:UDP-3-O-[3-hydroxymyristoyl] glucosamine N-acyltransferase
MSVDLIRPVSVAELEDFLESVAVEATLHACNLLGVAGISDGRAPKEGTICFVEDPSEVKFIPSVIYITVEAIENQPSVVTFDPRYVFIKFLEYIKKKNNYNPLFENFTAGIHPTAHIDERSIIEENVYIGEGVWIGAGAVIKKGVSIGRNSIVRENTVIGCPGIALYKAKNGEVLRFPHLSGVEIGSDVEIGANSVLVQGTLSPTVVGNDVVIGNLCNIGHGVIIKPKVWMSVGSLIGGNCVVEAGSTLGLGVSVRDNLEVGEGVSIGMGSVVTKSVLKFTSLFGNPAKQLRSLNTGPKR